MGKFDVVSFCRMVCDGSEWRSGIGFAKTIQDDGKGAYELTFLKEKMCSWDMTSRDMEKTIWNDIK